MKWAPVLQAALACVLWLVGDASVGMVGVQIKNGKCVLNGTEIENGKSVSLETPCESHVCDAAAKSVQIMGCGPIEAPPNCTLVNGTGTFPKCCRHAVCKSSSTQPLNVTALLSNITKC
ncbi:U-scoloptoxin(16)-Sm3a-like [Amblyomma americanum]